MITEITVQSVEEKKDEITAQFHAVAVNGTEMVAAKAGIQAWLERKLQSIEDEIVSLQAVHDSAVKHKWKSSTFKGQLQREKQKQLYYGKLLAACNAGFVIVPNMDVDVFAIRVKRTNTRAKPAFNKATGYAPSAPRIDDETEERLPVGEGRDKSDAICVLVIRAHDSVLTVDPRCKTEDAGELLAEYMPRLVMRVEAAAIRSPWTPTKLHSSASRTAGRQSCCAGRHRQSLWTARRRTHATNSASRRIS